MKLLLKVPRLLMLWLQLQWFSQQMRVQKPKLWSLSSPYLYTVTTEVLENERVIDCDTFKLGLRYCKV